MYEDVPSIDVGTAVMHFPSTGHTNVIAGGVRFSLCAEDEREPLEEMKRAEREDSWGPGTPTAVAPLHLCLFNLQLPPPPFIQNGYAYASPPSSPVCASRPILAWFEDPQAWKQLTTMVQALQPLMQLTAPPPILAPSTSRTSTSYTAAAAAGYEYEYD